MKKILALTIVILTLCAMLPAYAISFPDINSGHWAYAAVSELVSKGTIRGFTDGTFKPTNTVSRAEFVKMVGVGPNRRTHEYSDITKSHWAYDAIMTSGLSSDDKNNFNPEKAITRAQTINVLYKRYGVKGVKAPDFIVEQGQELGISTDAISWIYSYGVLIGADGIHLRLSDTLTRAEAAVLIAKCSKVNKAGNFVDFVSEDLLKKVMSAHPIFEEGTTFGDVITNAQLAEAMIKFGNDSAIVNVSKHFIDNSIEHEKSDALYIMCKSNIGMENFTVEFADALATVETAEKAVKNAAERVYGGDIVNNTFLYAENSKKDNSPVTCKDILALILQYDLLVGTNFAYTTDKVGDEYIKVNTKSELDITKYPYSHNQYAVILEEVPNEVYNFSTSEGNAIDIYDFARDYATLYMEHCNKYVMAAEKGFGVKMRITFYPSLAYQNEKGFFFKVKVTALNTTNYTPNDLFGASAITNQYTKLSAGTEFFTEIYVTSLI